MVFSHSANMNLSHFQDIYEIIKITTLELLLLIFFFFYNYFQDLNED